MASLIGKLYFDVQRAAALVEAIQAQITPDENALELARQRREAGVGTTLDVVRAESRLAADRHRLLEAENEGHNAQLRLLHAMGENLNSEMELTDGLHAALAVPASFEQSFAEALEKRSDWIAQDRKLSAARLASGGFC